MDYNPVDGRNEPQAASDRVLRGGSWGSDRQLARCAFRIHFIPGSFDFGLGLRVVLSLASSEF